MPGISFGNAIICIHPTFKIDGMNSQNIVIAFLLYCFRFDYQRWFTLRSVLHSFSANKDKKEFELARTHFFRSTKRKQPSGNRSWTMTEICFIINYVNMLFVPHITIPSKPEYILSVCVWVLLPLTYKPSHKSLTFGTLTLLWHGLSGLPQQ